ncbi:MAG: HK97 family phage prohead protease [Proteobacteria bacterium]|nr:HK97 family phage prohead protease [Pseudomonadota bacterium]
MADFLRDDSGRTIYVQGYAGVFDLPSLPMGRNDDCPEIVARGAFDAVLANPKGTLNCQFHHMGLDFIAGCLALDTLQIWADTFGLAFSAGPFGACGRNVALLNSITSNEVRWASWSGWIANRQFEIVNGERTRVIRRFKTLDHVSPVNEPAYPDTGIWLSSEHPYDLTPHLRALSEFWAANRPRHDTGRALRKMARTVSRLPRRALPPPATPRSVAKRRVPAPPAMHEVYVSGLGFSGAELARLCFQERRDWRIFNSNNPDISRAQLRERHMIGRASGASQPAPCHLPAFHQRRPDQSGGVRKNSDSGGSVSSPRARPQETGSICTSRNSGGGAVLVGCVAAPGLRKG